MWKSDTYLEPASSVTVAEGVLLKGMMGDINSEALKSLLIILGAFFVRSAVNMLRHSLSTSKINLRLYIFQESIRPKSAQEHDRLFPVRTTKHKRGHSIARCVNLHTQLGRHEAHKLASGLVFCVFLFFL